MTSDSDNDALVSKAVRHFKSTSFFSIPYKRVVEFDHEIYLLEIKILFEIWNSGR